MRHWLLHHLAKAHGLLIHIDGLPYGSGRVQPVTAGQVNGSPRATNMIDVQNIIGVDMLTQDVTDCYRRPGMLNEPERVLSLAMGD